jgi:DNA-binding MarR family transcriptional regulator
MLERRSFRQALIIAMLALFISLALSAVADGPDRMSITLDKQSCRPGDGIQAQVHVIAINHSSINVTLEVDGPDGTPFFVSTNTTDGNGTAAFSFRIPPNVSVGLYRLYASCLAETGILFAETSIEVQAPRGNVASPMPVVVPITATAIAVALFAAGLAIGGTEIGMFGLFALFAPLFTRLNKDQALDNRIRYQILGYLTENPGQHYSAVKKALNLNNGGAVYHILVLEREGFIRSQRDGILKRFYPAAIKAPEKHKRTPEELVGEILADIDKKPGITQKELVERLVINDEVVGYHLRKLVRDTRIISWKKGRTRVYYPVKKG